MTNTNPLVTIICSCFNHSKFVEKSLNSVLNQSYKNIQLLIIDDCSTDNSAEVIKQWLTKHDIGFFIQNRKNLGLTKSFNNAFFKYAKGDYFMDLAADDILLPNCLETLVSVFQNLNNNSVAMVYGNAKVIDTINNTEYIYYDRFSLSKKTSSPTDGFIYKEILDKSNNTCSVSSMIRSSIFKDIGGYDESLVYEDFDLWLRLARKYHILYKDVILVEHLEILKSLGYSNYLRFGKRVYRYKYSTYLILKKTLKMNVSKEEDIASIKKINIEIKGNLKIFNVLLVVKYLILVLRFKYRKHE